jgi:putative ABC transport system ATP-binding protein
VKRRAWSFRSPALTNDNDRNADHDQVAGAVVRLERVSRIYRHGDIEVRALQDVDLEIRRGDFAALVGPSGSGKTTLLNIIGGLDTPTSGRVWIGDTEITRLSAAKLAEVRLRQIGFVFQEYNLIPVLSALENVEYVMLLQGVPEDERQRRALALLKELGLEGMEHRRPAELSGGQQQRVAVARAIVSEPLIVLPDEPTANLDSAAGAALLDLMRSLNERKGVTFIFSTHDPLVMQRARRIIRMRDGRIVEEGLP